MNKIKVNFNNPFVDNLISLFNNNGYNLYLVGGSVRDFLLNRPLNDYDFTTDATVEKMEEILVAYKIDNFNANLGNIRVYIENECIEITMMREEEGVINYRYPEKITYVSDLEKDAKRRDFTINQLSYANGYIYDFYNGIDDLKKGIIRFINDPIIRIKEDPLRILRALRFAQSLNFNLQDGLENIFESYAYLINDLDFIKYKELYQLISSGNKEALKKYQNIYLKAFNSLNNEIINNSVSFSYEDELLALALIVLIGNITTSNIDKLNLNKNKRKLVNAFITFKEAPKTKYEIKKLIISYHEKALDILKMYSLIDNDISITLIEFYKDIINNKMPLTFKELDITNSDLLELGIPQKDCNKMLKYMLDIVLKDETKNHKEILKTYLKEQK